MAQTYAEARADITALVRTAWVAHSATAPLFYDNLDAQRPDVPQLFGRVTIRFLSGERAALGSKFWRRAGVCFVQVFVPHGSATAAVDAMVEALVEALEDPGAVGNIWFRDVGSQEIGSDGVYFQVNVTASFQFDRSE